MLKNKYTLILIIFLMGMIFIMLVNSLVPNFLVIKKTLSFDSNYPEYAAVFQDKKFQQNQNIQTLAIATNSAHVQYLEDSIKNIKGINVIALVDTQAHTQKKITLHIYKNILSASAFHDFFFKIESYLKTLQSQIFLAEKMCADVQQAVNNFSQTPVVVEYKTAGTQYVLISKTTKSYLVDDSLKTENDLLEQTLKTSLKNKNTDTFFFIYHHQKPKQTETWVWLNEAQQLALKDERGIQKFYNVIYYSAVIHNYKNPFSFYVDSLNNRLKAKYFINNIKIFEPSSNQIEGQEHTKKYMFLIKALKPRLIQPNIDSLKLNADSIQTNVPAN